METVLRVALIYVVLLAGMRLMGKREFGQLAPMEFIALLIIPELLQEALLGYASLTNAMIALATLFCLVFGNSLLSHVSKPFERISEGKPAVLAHHGQLVQANLDRERISPSELYSELRKSGLERLDEVRWAVLESDGKVAIVPIEPGKSKPKVESAPL